jgi:hypothetical protein
MVALPGLELLRASSALPDLRRSLADAAALLDVGAMATAMEI